MRSRSRSPATEAFDVFTFSGSAVAAQDAAVGISVAYSEITASAAAYVGANSGDILNRTATANVDDYAGGIVTGGYIHTGDLVIDAVSAGNGVSAAVAATYASDKPAGKLAGKLTAAVDKVKAFLGKSKAAQAAKSSTPADYNVAVSGSSAVMVTDRNSKAYVDGATLDRYGATGGVNTDIGAVSNAVLDTVSGSAAINLADPAGNSFAAAIAGAVAVGMSDGETSAYVANSAISNSSGLTVDALAGGQQTVIGLGVAINSSGEQAQSASMAGSVSLTEVNDQIGAGVRNSTVTGIGAGSGGVSVAAYQATDIATGAGSLYGGGKGGFGVAFTYSEIGNPDGANAVDAIVTGTTITNLARLNITAASSGHIVTGGATLGLLNNTVSASRSSSAKSRRRFRLRSLVLQPLRRRLPSKATSSFPPPMPAMRPMTLSWPRHSMRPAPAQLPRATIAASTSAPATSTSATSTTVR